MWPKRDGRTPEYWHGMADEARAMADGLRTETNRQRMLALAADYECLAEQARREIGRY